MARYVYRDYRPGQRGKFTSEETYNRSQAQGVECHIHREQVSEASISSLDDLAEYDDYDGDWEFYDVQGTGDTGHRE
jgi:hypothetical protein